jgi:hypothetical protein
MKKKFYKIITQLSKQSKREYIQLAYFALMDQWIAVLIDHWIAGLWDHQSQRNRKMDLIQIHLLQDLERI